jgi:hypothetical protein
LTGFGLRRRSPRGIDFTTKQTIAGSVKRRLLHCGRLLYLQNDPRSCPHGGSRVALTGTRSCPSGRRASLIGDALPPVGGEGRLPLGRAQAPWGRRASLIGDALIHLDG